MLSQEVTEMASAPLVRNGFTSLEGIRFTAACFQGPGNEWSLGPLQAPEDVVRHPILTERLRDAMRHLGAERVYAPSPVEFNGKIIQPAELSRVFNLKGGVLLFRNAGMPADGTFLRADGHAGVFSAGGCGLTVVTLRDHLIFAHTGRDCVIDRTRILTGAPSRSKESVIDSIMDAFHQLGYNEKHFCDLSAWVLYSIKPRDFLHRFDDPQHGEYNRRVGPDLARRTSAGIRTTPAGFQIDVPAIARSQFLAYGVPSENIHLDHAYLNDELPTTRRGGGRYLVAVVRHS